MKIILSRKGFDSGIGGYASFILSDGGLQSLPIPCSSDEIAYSQVNSRVEGKKLMELMQERHQTVKEGEWKKLEDYTRCHLDPDIDKNALDRLSGWRGCFGQIGAAQTVLENMHVAPEDLFLFFGWFQEEKGVNVSRQGKHLIFGYLQIGEILHTKAAEIPEWLKYHPHCALKRVSNVHNCIYIARERCSWNEEIPGYGVLRYSPELELTAPGMSRSKWKLPEIFRGVSMTYHTEKSWKDGYFQSAARGQEFVVEENQAIEMWARRLIEKYRSGSSAQKRGEI